jgi:hypothetical protein
MTKRSKTGGREAGTPNHITKELKESLKVVLENEVQKLPGLLETIKPEKRVEIIARLLPLVIPRDSVSSTPEIILSIDNQDQYL